jgi:hypothetical protein
MALYESYDDRETAVVYLKDNSDYSQFQSLILEFTSMITAHIIDCQSFTPEKLASFSCAFYNVL